MPADITPRPLLPPEDGKLPMSHQEASWHTHVAATRAAGNAPGDDVRDPASDLGRAASGGHQSVCGIDFPPLCAGNLLAIQSAQRLAASQSASIEGAEEAALLIYCLARGEKAFELAEAGDLAMLLREARGLLAPVPLREIPRLVEWCQAEIAAATGGGAGAEKKS